MQLLLKVCDLNTKVLSPTHLSHSNLVRVLLLDQFGEEIEREFVSFPAVIQVREEIPNLDIHITFLNFKWSNNGIAFFYTCVQRFGK